MKKSVLVLLCVLSLLLTGCGSAAEKPLPPPESDENSMFAIDKNINMETIDQYLDREDVEYRDLRMLFDPADYGAIGGDADLSRTIRGFKIVPFPYIATLAPLPVGGAYNDDCLFNVEWGKGVKILSAEPKYEESMMILEELFPKDKPIFLMCGGAGYAYMVRELLIYLGWDPQLLYNIGANWTYKGDNSVELIIYPEDAEGNNIYATWRADYTCIMFDRLHPIEGTG